MGKKWPKNDFGPTGKKRKEWPKNGKIVCQKWSFSHFSAIFPPFSRWGQNPFLGHFFPISGRRPDLGSVQGNRDRNGPWLISLPALQKTCVDFFFHFAWGFGIENWRGFLVIFCGLRFPGNTKHCDPPPPDLAKESKPSPQLKKSKKSLWESLRGSWPTPQNESKIINEPPESKNR